MENLQQAVFANVGVNWELAPFSWEFWIKMMHSDWTALPLLLHKKFWADLIRFAPWTGVNTHTHEWDHILLVLYGNGWVEYYGKDYELRPWIAYMIPWAVPHWIKAKDELVLMAIANDHRDAWSEERLNIVTN